MKQLKESIFGIEIRKLKSEAKRLHLNPEIEIIELNDQWYVVCVNGDPVRTFSKFTLHNWIKEDAMFLKEIK